ncbi:MAG: hypothetical protein ABW199_03590 [Caulobacterales bacterium]
MIQTLAPPIALLAMFGGLFSYAAWRAAQPADPSRPRMIPWRTVSVFAGFAAFLSAIYIIAQIRG